MAPLTTVPTLINNIDFNAVIHAILYLILGLFVAKFTTHWLTKLLAKRLSNHSLILTQRIIFYTIFVLFLIGALQHLGFKLNALLGAAGIVTVAIGFASQTSFSNIISGLFLMAEKSFKLGDSIKIDGVSGEVTSIDLLATKIKTADNTLVRVPNEVMIKSAITNLTHFPIRALNINLKISYQEEYNKVKRVLLQVAANNYLILTHPEPHVSITGFEDGAIILQFTIWAETSVLNQLKNDIYQQIKTAFTENQIVLPQSKLVVAIDKTTS